MNLESRNYAAAITNLNKAIELNPGSADSFCARGMSKWWLRDFSGAVSDYDRAIALNPKCGGYYCNRGQAEFSLKLFPQALSDYNKSIELDPKNTQAYFNRGTFEFLCLTNYARAIADFTRAIELHDDPCEEDFWFWRGNAKLQLKDYSGAIVDYKRSLALNPKSDYSLILLTNLSAAQELLREPKKQ